MSDEEDYNSEEDHDYVPSEGEQVSEEENSGDEEDLTLLQDDDAPVSPKKKAGAKGRRNKKGEIAARKRKGGIKLDEADAEEQAELLRKEQERKEEEESRRKELAEQTAKEEEERKKEREKKRADDLWSSFLSDFKKPPPRCPATSGSSITSLTGTIKPGDTGESQKSSKPEDEKTQAPGKVTITKVFDFAGEEIKVTKEVDANSKEALAEQKKQEKADQEKEKQESRDISTSIFSPSPSSSSLLPTSSNRPDLKRPAVGGLGSVLSKINKKNKMSTLEKSKMDWNSFKQKEGIDEDLKIHNKGKQGYMERMAFLNRADQRQFELERDLRLNTSKR